jgi:hypothetical protein
VLELDGAGEDDSPIAPQRVCCLSSSLRLERPCPALVLGRRHGREHRAPFGQLTVTKSLVDARIRGVDGATRIVVTDEEWAGGCLAAETFERARRAMLEDGFVVLDDLLPEAIIDALGARMHADVPALVQRHEGRVQRFPGHLQQAPPDEDELLFPEVLANAIVVSLCRSLLGAVINPVLYTANTNMPGSVRQLVHCDLVQLWPDLDPVPAAPYAVVANFALVDTTDANAVELWPGTHLDGRTHGRMSQHRDIPADWLDERRAERPPIQVPQRTGSLLLRDIRVWHAGVANTSDVVRVMVGVGYSAGWYAGYSLPIPPRAAAAFERCGVPMRGSAASAAEVTKILAARSS